MSIETRISRLVKKTGVKKSRWTVPLQRTTTVVIQSKIMTIIVFLSLSLEISWYCFETE
jgi:hypothetical protein